MAESAKNATKTTAEKNKQVLSDLPFADKQDYTDADTGFIAGIPDEKVLNEQGEVVLDINHMRI